MKKKQCVCCRKIKPVEEFKHDRYKKDGFGSYCKICNQDTFHEHYLVNREHYLQQSMNFRQRNPEYHKEYYQRNREVIIERVKDWQYARTHIVLPNEPLVVLPVRDMSRGQVNKRW